MKAIAAFGLFITVVHWSCVMQQGDEVLAIFATSYLPYL